MTDYYQTLGINKNASEDEIKQAYRRMASKHHPDRGGDTQKFQEIEEAYRVLSDPGSKGNYDSGGPQQHHHHGGFGGGNPFEDIFRHFGGNPFGDIFGRHAHFGPRNRTLNAQATITLEEAFYGKELLANITLPDGVDQMLSVKIPPGIQDGTTLRLSGMGEDTVKGVPRGDIHLTVRINPHNIFTRQGDDLVTELTLPVWDAILGNTIKLKTIDNRELEITINPGTQPDQTLSIQGAGMPNMNNPRFKGRLLLKLKFSIPAELNEQQKSAIRSAIA